MEELLHTAGAARFRVLEIRGEEHNEDDEERSWQRFRCHVHREDVPSAAIPLLYALSALSFVDARPRAGSAIDYHEVDEWSAGDFVSHLRLERGSVALDADYVRGRMMKTRITISDHGRLVIETRNRYHMIQRWLEILRGRRHLRPVALNGE